MNALSALVFVLFVASARAGLVAELVGDDDNIAGFRRGTPNGRTDIINVDGWTLALEIAPYSDQMGAPKNFVRVLWKDKSKNYHPLQLVKINWPSGASPNIQAVKSSFQWGGMSADNQMSIKYLTDTLCIFRKYKWQSGAFVPGAAVNVPLANC